ncbi:MAG: hypothetical protein KJ558_13560, partial [Gammaproteobacteria bacterium]|nr:hypothetical protein [Gammaproteobacteria bacterium]
MDNIALRFRSDLVDLIEQSRLFSRQSRSHRRGSGSAAKIDRLKIGQMWPEDEMQDVQVILARRLR